MFPKVYEVLRAAPAVVQTVGDRIARHGEISQGEARPYIVWQIVSGLPYDHLSGAAVSDFTGVQLDCYHQTDKGVEELARAVRAALDAALIVNRVILDHRDPDTKLYRVGLQADFIENR